ncbi:MAG TPA: peptidoglycan editing factor PgeF [Solirubrobacteraceae bacterium]|jgi:hypothetical protein
MSQGRDLHHFELPGGGRAIFTTKRAGNLSLAAGVGHEQGLHVREQLCDELGLQWLCAGPQVHGTIVRRVMTREQRGGTPVREQADGHATALSRVGVMVLAADCVPVVLGTQGAVAAVHAGWRGLAAGVLEEGVSALRELSSGGEVQAVIGPCAGACCYEVGAEVLQSFTTDLRALGEPLSTQSEKAKLDLRQLARHRLLTAGVEQVDDLEICTICDEGMFSHRREGQDAGRQAAVAWLP